MRDVTHPLSSDFPHAALVKHVICRAFFPICTMTEQIRGESWFFFLIWLKFRPERSLIKKEKRFNLWWCLVIKLFLHLCHNLTFNLRTFHIHLTWHGLKHWNDACYECSYTHWMLFFFLPLPNLNLCTIWVHQRSGVCPLPSGHAAAAREQTHTHAFDWISKADQFPMF